jgi:hypothetical protein
MARQRRVERQCPGIDQLQHGVGKDRLGQGGRVENGVLIDRRTITRIAHACGGQGFDAAVADNRHRQTGNLRIDDQPSNVGGGSTTGHGRESQKACE